MPFRVGIIGPGAVGLYLYSGLASVFPTTLFDHRRDRVSRTQGERLEVWEDGVLTQTALLKVSQDPKTLREQDLLFVVTKAYSNSQVIQTLQESGWNGPIVLVQNGLGGWERFRETFPKLEVVPGVTYDGSFKRSELQIQVSDRVGFEFLESPSLLRLREAFHQFLSPLKTSNDLSFLIRKAQVSILVNPVTALLRVRNGFVLQEQYLRDFFDEVDTESMAVLQELYGKEQVCSQVERAMEACRDSATNSSSMREDLRNHRPTEIDFLNGFISRQGRRLGIATPRNDFLTHQVVSMGHLRRLLSNRADFKT